MCRYASRPSNSVVWILTNNGMCWQILVKLCNVKFNQNLFSGSQLFLVHVQISVNQSIGMNRMRWFLAVLKEPPPYLPIIHYFQPLFSTNNSSILPHFIQPSISWSPSWPYCFQIHVQYSFGILFSSTLCTCPNERYLCSLIVSVLLVVGF